MVKDKTAMLILAILALFLIAGLRTGDLFILYGGIDVPGNVTNISGICWTLADSDRCVKQRVQLINFTEQLLLVCPESYYVSEQACKEAFGLIPKPTITCYFIEDYECLTETLEAEICPSQYFSSLELCTEELEESKVFHLKTLFQNKATIFMIIAGIIAVLVLVIPRIRW